MKKIIVFITFIVAIFLLFFIRSNTRGDRVGGLDITRPKTESVLASEYSTFIPKTPQTKDSFQILIIARDLPDSKPKENPTKITLKEFELPFYRNTDVILNIYDGKQVNTVLAKILRTEITKSSVEVWADHPTDIYKITVQLPENLNAKLWDALKQGGFSVSKNINTNKKLIPKNFILDDLKDSSKHYVCIIDRKREALSMDYQYYWIKGYLQPITITEITSYKGAVDMGAYVAIEDISFDDEFAIPLSVSSCVKNPQEYRDQKSLIEYNELKNKVDGLKKVLGVTEEGYVLTENKDYKFGIPLGYDNLQIFKNFAKTFLIGEIVRIELEAPDKYLTNEPDVLAAKIYWGDDLLNSKYEYSWKEAATSDKTPFNDLKYYKNVNQIAEIYAKLNTQKNIVRVSGWSIFPDGDPTKKAIAPFTTEGNVFPLNIDSTYVGILINNNRDNKNILLSDRYAKFLQNNWQKELVIDYSDKEKFFRSYQCFNGYDCNNKDVMFFEAPARLGGVLLNEAFK